MQKNQRIQGRTELPPETLPRAVRQAELPARVPWLQMVIEYQRIRIFPAGAMATSTRSLTLRGSFPMMILKRVTLSSTASEWNWQKQIAPKTESDTCQGDGSSDTSHAGCQKNYPLWHWDIREGSAWLILTEWDRQSLSFLFQPFMCRGTCFLKKHRI